MDNAIILQPDPRRGLERMIPVIRSICTGLRRIHDRGVVLGDFAPQNLLVNTETHAVTFIDFETAIMVDEPRVVRTGTNGFVSENRKRGQALTFQDDLFSLSRILFSLILPACPLFDLEPEAESRILALIQRERAFPFPLEELIYDVPGDLATAERKLDALEAQLTRRPARQPVKPSTGKPSTGGGRSDAEWDRLLRQRIASLRGAILASVDGERDDCMVPSDWRVPPGLFVGASGLAWVLAEIGEPQRAMKVDSPRRALPPPAESICVRSLDFEYQGHPG